MALAGANSVDTKRPVKGSLPVVVVAKDLDKG